MEWYVARNGQTTGPLSFDDLTEAKRRGQLSREDLVWRTGMSEWAAAGAVPDLADLWGPPPLPGQASFPGPQTGFVKRQRESKPTIRMRIGSGIGEIVGAIGGFASVLLFALAPIGAFYWIWIAIKLGSFTMFVLGVLGPTTLLTAPIGLYMLIFGIPRWVLYLFG